MEKEEESVSKRIKTEDHIHDELLPILPLEMIQLIVKYVDVFTAANLLVSARCFAKLLTEEAWKLLYLLRWHGNILRKAYSNEGTSTNHIKNIFRRIVDFIK